MQQAIKCSCGKYHEINSNAFHSILEEGKAIIIVCRNCGNIIKLEYNDDNKIICNLLDDIEVNSYDFVAKGMKNGKLINNKNTTSIYTVLLSTGKDNINNIPYYEIIDKNAKVQKLEL